MKGRKPTLLVLAILLSSSIPAAFSTHDTFSVDYTFEPALDSCGEFLVKDTHIQEIPGEPLVPYKAATILVPQDAVVEDVKVKCETPIVQQGIDILWGQPPCTFSDTPVRVGKNEEIYNSLEWYPHEIYNVVSVESFRGFKILNVILYPVQYQPKSQTVKCYPRMTVTVKVGKGLKNKLYRGLAGDKTDVAGMVDNPEMVSTYENGPTPLQTEQYIIITNNALESTFQRLADYKACFINGAGVYTVSWITAAYTGVDDAEKVRNFIKDMYQNHGTRYVLLGGDIAVVPYRGFYVATGGYTDYDMLADMYFAHLDGTFNDDGDSNWAEPEDGVDLYAEVAVGRAPVENTTEAQNFFDKVFTYEACWKPKRVLLHQSRVQSGNIPDSRCLAWTCDDWVPSDYYCDYLFEEDGINTKTRWTNAWAANPVAVMHIGHGSATSYNLSYEIGGTITWHTSDVSSLTNMFWPWHTTVACHTGEIEYNDCLAEVYVTDDCGAIACIHNNNYGWYSTLDACKYSGEFCEMEFKACWSDGYEKFGELLNQARSYLVSSAQSNSTYRWCFYERNLVGDPEIPSLSPRFWDCFVTILNPQHGETVFGIVDITADGCTDTMEFYIDGVLEYTDTTPPFVYRWDTTTYSDGSHTIFVEQYVCGLPRNDRVTVTVDNTVPHVTITNPQEGQPVSRTILITTDTHDIDTVEFYIDDKLKHTDTTPPFEYKWNTRSSKDGTHAITVKGYASGIFIDNDSVTVTVKNKQKSIALLSFLVFLLPVGIYRRR
ncbi:MAG: hypothetical protein HXS48_21410 [Theionarchaea archaeon]|nr:MAG: hypothetical protein AYK19_05675 [Theionarchaea archaeon DG-70-1]MBU7029505.1 hypothetical protein [Theionarchaea archaeon]